MGCLGDIIDSIVGMTRKYNKIHTIKPVLRDHPWKTTKWSLNREVCAEWKVS